MKLTEVLCVLERVAPVALSDEFCRVYKLYDNSGIIIDCGADINGAVFSLDLSSKAISRATELGYNLIITHHPAIYGGISRINCGDPVAQCVKKGISVISMHLNFDAAPEGIDYHLMRGLGGETAELLAPIDGGGYGRAYTVKGGKFAEYAERVKKTFGGRALFYGDGEKIINKVASFCGAGCDDKAIAFALSSGADAFVSSDMKHHEIAGLIEQGLNVIHLTHYASENYGFNKIYSRLADSLKIPSVYFTDETLG